mgnify:FL=1
MSDRLDTIMLQELGVPEGFGMETGCNRVQPYKPSDGLGSHGDNLGRDRNNTRYGPRWMGWADE